MNKKTFSYTVLVDQFLEFKKKQIKEKQQRFKINQTEQPFLIDIEKFTEPKIEIYKKKIDQYKPILEKEIKQLKSFLVKNPKLEITRNFHPDFYSGDYFDNGLIVRKTDDPSPIYKIQRDEFKTNEFKADEVLIYEFIQFSFKLIKQKLILKFEQDSRKLKKIQKSNEDQVDLIVSRTLINHELEDNEKQLSRLDAATKKYHKETNKLYEKYIETEDNKDNKELRAKLKKEYLAKREDFEIHSEMLKEYKETPKNNYTIYEHLAILAVGSLAKKHPKTKIPLNPTKFLEVLGIDQKSNQSLNELRNAVLDLAKKPYYSSNLFYDYKRKAFLKKKKFSNIPIFDVDEIDLIMPGTKKKSYGITIANEFILDDLEKNYLRVLDILPQMYSYFSRVDKNIYQLCTYIHHRRMSFILGNRPQTQKLSIIELIKRTEKKNLLNEDMTTFKNRKNKYTQVKIIESVLNFFAKNNYMKPEFEIDKENEPFNIIMTFVDDPKIKKIPTNKIKKLTA